MVSYRPIDNPPETLPPASRSAAYTFLSRQVFRRQIGSERGKEARWYAETVLLPPLAASRPLTRNTILSYPVSVLAETSRRRTDILHEYFIPPERFGDFLAACREIIPPSKQDLLNVTLRYVDADPVSVLSFAPAPRIAAVMLFTQGVTAEADRAMAAMTERLIDAVLALGGSFYLPYRLHARREQVFAAYPRLGEFAEKKWRYDPQLRFRNEMWDRYFVWVVGVAWRIPLASRVERRVLHQHLDELRDASRPRFRLLGILNAMQDGVAVLAVQRREKFSRLAVAVERALQVRRHGRRALGVVGVLHRPSRCAAAIAARPAGLMRWPLMSASALVRLIFDHLLLALRGVNFCSQYVSSSAFFWPSIQP